MPDTDVPLLYPTASAPIDALDVNYVVVISDTHIGFRRQRGASATR